MTLGAIPGVFRFLEATDKLFWRVQLKYATLNARCLPNGRRLALLRKGGDAYVNNGDSDAFGASGQCCFHYIQHHKKEINRRASETLRFI